MSPMQFFQRKFAVTSVMKIHTKMQELWVYPDYEHLYTPFKPDSHLPKQILFICINKSPLRMMKNAFYFTLKALLVFKIF